MKKVIEQKDESRIEVEFHEHRIQLTLMSPFDDFGGEVVIGKSAAREVSLAICPELETESKEKDARIKELEFANEEVRKKHDLARNVITDQDEEIKRIGELIESKRASFERMKELSTNRVEFCAYETCMIEFEKLQSELKNQALNQ